MAQILSSAGYHGEGRLGRKGNSNQLNRITTEMPPLLMFSCGWKHNIFITTEHQVYVCGDNGDGQLGPDIQQCFVPTISRRLSELHPVWSSCGDKMTALLSEDGHVYACGVGWGVGPVELTAPSEVVYISCGVSTICGIGVNGEFYQWTNHAAAATRLQCDAKFCDCAAGNFQTFGLSTTGVLYVTGRSKSCGQGRKWSSSELVPVQSLSGIVIKRIFAYCNHSVAIDEEGRVYVCGSNNYCQLGLDVRKANVFMRVPVFDEHPVITASLGDTFTAFITENLELYTCGDGDEYRLCNTTIGKVHTPTLADAAIGKLVMWISCGCSHMIIAENLEEIPQHPGRAYFGLDGTTRRKRRKLPSLSELETVNSLTKPVSVDKSDYGTIWTGYANGDIVESKEHGRCVVLGTTLRGLVIRQEKPNQEGEEAENFLVDLKDLRNVFESLKVVSRDGCTFEVLNSRGGFELNIDNSPSSSEVFGFCPGDRVHHPILGDGTIKGVFGGCLWFMFDDDEGRISTTLVSEIQYLHKWLRITKGGNNREVKYCTLSNSTEKVNQKQLQGTTAAATTEAKTTNNNKLDSHSSENEVPVETFPCEVLSSFGLKIGDLVETENGIGEIFGSFRHFAVVKDILTKSLSEQFPSSLLLLRRETDKKEPVCIDHLTLDGLAVSVDVSCHKDDVFKPFDRVNTKFGTATLCGKKDGKWWLQTDDALALGGGIGFVSDDSSFQLIRRIGNRDTTFHLGDFNIDGCKENDKNIVVSVSTEDFKDLTVLPGDLIIANNGKFKVVGMNVENRQVIGVSVPVSSTVSNGKLHYFSDKDFDNVSIVFRSDLPATRIYYSKTGNGLNLSVSMRDFVGKRFIADDLIETPFGVGLVVGMADSNLGIHLNTEHGVSFFTPQSIYDSSLFKLIKRRAIVSLINT